MDCVIDLGTLPAQPAQKPQTADADLFSASTKLHKLLARKYFITITNMWQNNSSSFIY
jgi:hypothetical protein